MASECGPMHPLGCGLNGGQADELKLKSLAVILTLVTQFAEEWLFTFTFELFAFMLNIVTRYCSFRFTRLAKTVYRIHTYNDYYGVYTKAPEKNSGHYPEIPRRFLKIPDVVSSVYHFSGWLHLHYTNPLQSPFNLCLSVY